jgi:hypothetical protein
MVGAETLLPGQVRCECVRLWGPRWNYCPICGSDLVNLPAEVV